MLEFQIAIYELVAVVLALPLSYGLAYLSKKWVDKLTAYQNQIDHLFITYWNGRSEDEYYAWQQVRFQLLSETPSKKELKYVHRKLKNTDKSTYLSGSYISKSGRLKMNENPPIIHIDNEHF